MTYAPINKNDIYFGLQNSIATIKSKYPTAEAASVAPFNGYLGLNVDPSILSVGNTMAVQSSFWDRLYNNAGNEIESAVSGFVMDWGSDFLDKQKSLSLAFTKDIYLRTSTTVSIEQAISQTMSNGTIRSYVEKVTGKIVQTTHVFSETTHIPLGKFMAGAGHALSAYAIYDTLKNPIIDAYNATTGAGDTITPIKSYTVASAGIIVGGLATAFLGGGVLAAAAGAVVGYFAVVGTKTILDELPAIIDSAKLAGKTLLQTQLLIEDFITDKVEEMYSATGTKAKEILDDAEKYAADLTKGMSDLSEDYGWALNNPDAVLGGLLPSWLVPAGLRFGQAPLILSPLVLDLDGDGVEVSKLGYGTGSSTVYFDMDNDGFAERTAWANGGDGLLALDKNGNGKIDNQNELFGNNATYADGFLNLKQYDSNNDNQMTSADAQWNNLRVWVDADNDGQTDAGELKTLSSLGITQINLAATALTDIYLNENLVSDTSSFVMNGATRTVSDVWFRNNTMDTRYQGDVTLDVRTLFLPTLKGFGELKDLHVAMSLDTSLLTMVQNFVSTWSLSKFANPVNLDNEIKAILYKWAEVDAVVAGSRGSYVDAKILSFMEVITGQDYGVAAGSANSQPLTPNQGNAVTQAFELAFDTLKTHIILQAGASSLYTEKPVYNLASGEISSGVLSDTAIANMKAEALLLPESSRLGFWSSAAEILLQVKDRSEFTATESTLLDTAISTSVTGQTWNSVTSLVLAQYTAFTFTGTNFADYLVGTSGNDNLNGGAGDDTYRFAVGDGTDIVYETSGNDTILMGAGITSANIRFENYNNHLNIYYGTTDKVTLYYQFYDDAAGSSNYDEIETLKFADGSSINLKAELTFTGTAAANSVYGTNLNDILIGGLGNDSLSGGAGDDTYRFNIGDGIDSIYETSGNDTVLMGAGITAANIRFENSGNNLNIYYGTSDKVTLYYQFSDDAAGSSNYDEIETLKFVDGSSINLKAGLTFTGTATVDTVYGTNMSDVLNGLAGNDNLNSFGGNDTLTGGLGNDTLQGAAGDDTYRFNIGDGIDSIYETSGNDTVLMGAGITSANIRFEKSGNNLNIYYGTTDKVTLYYQFYDDAAGTTNYDEVETLKFANGTSINLKAGLTFTGTAGADTVYGTNMSDVLNGLAGNDNLYAYAGNDTVDGGLGNDYMDGGAGVDTASYAGASGAVTVNLALTTAQSTGAAGIDTLANFENIFGSAFNDILTGNSVTNNLAGGNGNDTLDGGLGNDVLNGGNGDDILIGGKGLDQFTGGAGIDTFKFQISGLDTNIDRVSDFSVAQGDKLDLKDILIGYDPLTKAITDFVEFTTVGANTLVKVDRDGTGTAHTWQSVVQLNNLTGLTDEDALRTSGHLVVA